MASVKRVTTSSGNLAPYDIYANVITIHGNLNVVGNTSTISSTNTSLKDNVIILNYGETGSGVTLGNAGVYVDRGLSSNVALLWREAASAWQITNDGTTFYNILTSAAGSVAGGNTTEVQFNSGGTLAGNTTFTFTGGNLKVYNTVIGDGNVTTAASSNKNLTLTADGTGHVMVNDVLMLTFQGTAPTNIASNVQVFANTVGTGGTGIYVVNSSTAGDEMITKMKALAFNLLMS